MDFPVVRAFLMRIGTLVLSLFLGACIRQNPVHAPESALAQSSPQALMESHRESFAQIIANWPDKMIVANGDSLSQLRGMSPLERAALFIATDLSSVTRGYVDPLLVPYVEASTSEIEISRHIQEFDIISRNGKLYRSTEEHKAYENLADLFSIKKGGTLCQMIIPFHPDTVQKPPLVAESLSSGASKGSFDLMAFRSMSRSLFILNTNYEKNQLPILFSIKMGTDAVVSVRNSVQPQKLLGLQEHVARVNRFARESSLLELATESGILMLSDSVGLNFHVKGSDQRDDRKNNGVIIRGYQELLTDRDRIYMPLAKFRDQVVAEGSKSVGDVPVEGGIYSWELFRTQNRRVSLYFTLKDYQRMTRSLAYQYGQLIGAYYVNGYTSRDIHGQNLLVGIPLDPKLPPRLALRDLSDHAAFPFMVSGVKSSVLAPIPIHNWHHFRKNNPSSPVFEYVSVLSYQEMGKLMMAGYRQIEEKVKLPPRAPSSLDILDIYRELNTISNPELFDQIKRIRRDYRMSEKSLPQIDLQAEITGRKHHFLRRFICAQGCF